MNFLDKSGLKKLWTKIKNTFVNISDIGETICPIIDNYIPVKYIPQDNRINTVQLFSQVVVIDSLYTIIVVNEPNNGIVFDFSNISGPFVVDINTCIMTKPIEVDKSFCDQFLNFNGTDTADSRLEPGRVYHMVYDDMADVSYLKLL